MNILKQILGIAALAALAAGCAKDSTTDTSGLEKAYIEAWMSVNHPGVEPTGMGVYIIDDQPGTGEVITDDDFYLFAEYTSTDLSGNVSSTTSENLAKQIGKFKAENYYGQDIVINSRLYTQVGALEMIKGMRVGGRRTAVIPSWLNTTADYDTVEEYMKNIDGSNVIYTISVTGKTDDIIAWQIDTLQKFVAANMAAVDSVKFGYYYMALKEPADTTTLPRDTSYYINYTGRLLNGHVFDTTIEDTAKVHGIWSASKTYSPIRVTMAEDYTEVKMGGTASTEGNTTVDGFAFCLSRLKLYEKGVCAFYSGLGYGYEGSDNVIPRFAPISFEIEMVDEPDE